MRKKKQDSWAAPYIAGIIAGYVTALVLAALSAGALTLTDSVDSAAGAAAVLAVAVGSFICGKVAGIIRRRNGLGTGALCGVIFVLPLVLLSIIFGLTEGFLLAVKASLCVIFGIIGGVSGVNSDYGR